MTFENHRLTPPLNQYLEAIFHYKDFMPDHSIERVVPTGHLFIIFELDGFPRHTFDNDSLQPNATFTKVWISGMHRNYISISAHGNSEMFVIQFKASGAYPFFHQPIYELTEKILSAEFLFGEDILQLREDLLKKENSAQKFRLAENWLLEKYDEKKSPPKYLLKTIGELQKSPVANFEEIISNCPHSQKHLIDQFKKYVGLTPKYYQRILRFNDILQKIKQQKKISWAQTAYQCGYSDQSHFIKEFKHFSGFNPQEFIKEPYVNEEMNFFPLDRKG